MDPNGPLHNFPTIVFLNFLTWIVVLQGKKNNNFITVYYILPTNFQIEKLDPPEKNEKSENALSRQNLAGQVMCEWGSLPDARLLRPHRLGEGADPAHPPLHQLNNYRKIG